MTVEEYREEALNILQRNLEQLKADAEQILGQRIKRVKPIGSITDPTRFNEDSDVDVAFYINVPGEVDEAMSMRLQQYFINHPLPTIGVINSLVFR